MEILKKIQQARQNIKANDLKKAGWNDYSKYAYYTPEQVEKLVNDATIDLNLFNKYDLIRTDDGLMAILTIYDLDSDETVEFKIATEIPEIKATNVAQQLGGAVTYSERYLKMIAYEIKDNNLDFDTPKKNESKKEEKSEDLTPDGKKKEWLNKWDKGKTKELDKYWKIINHAKEKGMTIKDLRQYYKINKEVAKELETDLT